MDEDFLSQLREIRKKTEELEARAISSLEAERDRIAELRSELKERATNRNALILELMELGFTAARVSVYAGLVPSNITALQQKSRN